MIDVRAALDQTLVDRKAQRMWNIGVIEETELQRDSADVVGDRTERIACCSAEHRS